MPNHKETLKFIGKKVQFGERAADFLHASMFNKNKKIADCKQQEQKEPVQKLPKDVWRGVPPGDEMKRVGAAQRAICNTNIPFLFHSVQQHLKSNDHTNSKENFHNLTLLNKPTLKVKFDMSLNSENPFGNPQEQQLQLERLEVVFQKQDLKRLLG
ncbi:hypothetical protein scyTo_0006234 [Scyliorhinus torazame]|uniref:Uncharacterized protein n=1 Tax=Scyliorhinus torazame TaxID=75743 RepID=A0A401PGP0_SCYTO|nr:hypothetical protein [Scyliorhinus torazame]